MSGQVLFHPSHICQIGESDQGLIEEFYGNEGFQSDSLPFCSAEAQRLCVL
jgi:hypothetical protein